MVGEGAAVHPPTAAAPFPSPPSGLALDADRGLAEENQRLRAELAALAAVQERLRLSEERFACAVRGSSDGIWDWDIQSGAVYFSPRYKEQLGYDENELSASFAAFESRLHPDDHERVIESVRRHLSERERYDVEFRLRGKSGEYKWIRARGQAIWDECGQPLRMAGSHTEISLAKQAESALAERVQLASMAAQIGLALTREDELDAALRRCAAALLEHGDAVHASLWIHAMADDALAFRAGAGAPWCAEDHPHRRPCEPIVEQIAWLREPVLVHDVRAAACPRVEWWLASADAVAFAGLPLVCGDRAQGVLTMFFRQPLTCSTEDALRSAADAIALGIERHNVVLELQRAKQAAEAASRAKSDFLANMSHEIRTPMTAILGFASVLLDDPDFQKASPSRLEDLRAIERNARHLLTIINDILDLSKIEAGKMRLERIPCLLPQLVIDVISLMRVGAREKGLSLDVNFEGPIPKTIATDPTRLRQVLINLINNAVKFTEEGRVEVTVRLRANATPPRLRFDVRDTGVGMTAEEQARLFQPFTQADNSTTRRFGGTGLGLTISKRLTAMLGGELFVDSRPGRGSTFTLELSLDARSEWPLLEGLTESALTSNAGSDEPAIAPPPRLAGRILLAEDGPDNRRLIAFHLHRAGAEVVAAEDGQEAVERAMAAEQAGAPFAAILMDMQMPVMDGYTATRLLRQRGYVRPIIALTANAMADDQRKCLNAGCDDYAAKPIERRALVAKLAQWIGRVTD